MGGRGASGGGRYGELTVGGVSIMDAAREYLKKYKYVGIRTQEEPFALGEIAHESSVWKNGVETGKSVGGISATSVRSEAIVAHSDIKKEYAKTRKYKNVGYYYGNNVAIVVSNDAKRGYDAGEMVMRGARVVKILRQ